MSKKQNSINEPLINVVDVPSEDHETEKKGARKSMKVNMSVHSVDEFIAEKIVQSMYPKGEKEQEKDEELEVVDIIPNQSDNERSIFDFLFKNPQIIYKIKMSIMGYY